MPKMTELISAIKANPTSALWRPGELEKPVAAIMVKPGFLSEVDYWGNIITPKSTWNEHQYNAVIRYGCTANIKRGVPVLNKASAIHLAYDKPNARQAMYGAGLNTVPHIPNKYPKIIRPKHHHKGKWFSVALNQEEETKAYNGYVAKFGGAYTTNFIDKVAEYRIHATSNGWLLLGQRKVKNEEWEGERDGYQFNANNGYVFMAMKFKELNRFGFCCDAIKALGLDFGAVDVIEDSDGKLYILEVNTAAGSYDLLKKVYKAYFEEWIKSGYKLPQLETPEIFMKKERLEGLFAN